MVSDDYFYKVGGIAVIAGVVVLLGATLAHPMTAPPADSHAAFLEYAEDHWWVISHLVQLLGAMLITAGFVALSWRLRHGRAGVWSILGSVGAISTLALTGALQAVDGIALKVMVDRWAQAPLLTQPLLFEGALAVRQIEVGLASIVILFTGVTTLLYAPAFWLSEKAPGWLGWLGAISGIAMLVSGSFYALTGFSEVAMMVAMPSTLILLLWQLLFGVFLLVSDSELP